MPDLTPVTPARLPRISLIGTARWDQLRVGDTQIGYPGGTAVISSAVLSRLGAKVSLRVNVGDDEHGRDIISSLVSTGISMDWVITLSDTRTRRVLHATGVANSTSGSDLRTAEIRRGDRIDIAGLFGHDLVLIDVADMPLLRFLVDLPAHTLPGARLFGTLTHLASQRPVDAFDLLMRHDAVIGTPEEFLAITETASVDECVTSIRGRMRGENLRSVFVQDQGKVCSAFTIDGAWQSHDPVSAGVYCQEEIVVGSIAFGLALRWPYDMIVNFAAIAANQSAMIPNEWIEIPTLDKTLDALTRRHLTL